MKRLFTFVTKIMPIILLIITVALNFTLTGCGFSRPLTLTAGQDLHGTLRTNFTGPLKVGDQILLTLTVEAGNKVTYQLPNLFSQEIAGLELLKTTAAKPEKFSNGTRQIVRYTLTGWQPGKYLIPALNINYDNSSGGAGTYTIPGLPIEVVSVLPVNKPNEDLLGLDIKPIKNPVSLPPNYKLLQQYLIGIAAFLVIFLILRWFYRKLTRKTAESLEIFPPEPAHIIALARLTVIRENQYLEKGDFNAYYSELSECIREYIENRYQIKALEMTTEEFLSHLVRNPLLDEEYQIALQKFLNQSDLVKFAKQSPTLSEANQALTVIETIIEVTKEQPESTEENIA